MRVSGEKALWRALKSGASLVVLGVAAAALAPSMAAAQDAKPAAKADPAVSEVVVTGQRKALKTAQQLKRDADTVVDSITAADIGAFPDKSVAEALQRVPGVTVNRFSASDDTSHFSAEPSGVIVRGLPQVRNEFNGRDSFSANSGRGLGWGDVSPELMAGVDTYKNQTADLIEGGVAGTVNLRTRLPFDTAGHQIGGTLNVNWGDLSKKFTPEGSLLLANRWDTELGEFGLLGDIAYSKVETRSQGIQYGRMAVFKDFYGPGYQYIPSSVAERDVIYDRVRNGMALAGQWQDHAHKFLLTAQYNRSTYENTWKEHGIISYPSDLFALPADYVIQNDPAHTPEKAPLPAPGSSFTFDSAGNFQNGTFNVLQCCTAFGGGNSWWGVDDSPAQSGQIALNSSGQGMLEPCYSWQPTCTSPTRAPDFNAVTRYVNTRNVTEDGSVNLKWNATDRLKLNFDLQRVKSTVNSYDIEVGQYSFADMALDARGDLPRMTLLAPTNINQSSGGLTNPDNYRYNHAMDHLERDEGTETAFRADAQYAFHSQWLDSLKVGVRYSDREQTVRYSGFNWANIANDWNLGASQYTFWNIDNHTPNGAFNGYPAGLYEVMPFGGGSFFGGPKQNYVFFNMDALAAHKADLLSYANLGVGQDQWAPICTRSGEIDGCFRQEELNDVSEKTASAYAMLKFGGPDALLFGHRVSGNVGVRYVETRDRSTGSVAYPRPFTAGDLTCTFPASPPAPVNAPGTPGCYLSADDIAFNAGGGARSTVSTIHRNWLPSFNVKFDINDQWLLRFAASRAMQRPDIGLLKNYVSIETTLPGTYIFNSSNVVTGIQPSYHANAYNPGLAPATADQFDLSLEHYFAAVGSFSVDVFYKKFHDYIQYGTFNQDYTINGVTRTVAVTGPSNRDGASIQGFEVAYQRFFDFLPGAWNGLGVQANYTYVDNKGVSNSNLKVASGGGSGATPQPGTSGTSLAVNQLEGMSKHAYNLVGMYEKGPISARLAYNWRSEYLVTAVDCCIYLPMWQDAAGFLDGSIRYRLNNHVELSLEGSNLLNTRTVLKQQVTSAPEALMKDGSWFQNDRRVVAGIRFKY